MSFRAFNKFFFDLFLYRYDFQAFQSKQITNLVNADSVHNIHIFLNTTPHIIVSVRLKILELTVLSTVFSNLSEAGCSKIERGKLYQGNLCGRTPQPSDH